jgi:competence protein ComEA
VAATQRLPGADRRLTMFRTTLVALLTIGFGIAVLAAQAPAAKPAATPAATAAAPLNLNTATAAQLETLPGVGKSMADRIIEYRQKNGGFKKAEDLMNVKGIGEKSFLKLKSMVTVAAAKAERPATQE